MKRNRLAVAGVTGALLAGAGAGFVMSMPSGAAAQPSISAAADPTAPTPDAPSNGQSVETDGHGGGPGHGGRGGGHGGPGHGGRGGGPRGALLDTAATTIGITKDDLVTAIRSGQSIAEVTTANGVEVQTVIDALVQEASSTLTERITKMVNGTPHDDSDDDTTPPTTGG